MSSTSQIDSARILANEAVSLDSSGKSEDAIAAASLYEKAAAAMRACVTNKEVSNKVSN